MVVAVVVCLAAVGVLVVMLRATVLAERLMVQVLTEALLLPPLAPVVRVAARQAVLEERVAMPIRDTAVAVAAVPAALLLNGKEKK